MSGQKRRSFSSEEIQISTPFLNHSMPHSRNYSGFAFIFLGDEPLAPSNKTFMSLSSPILEGIEILQKSATPISTRNSNGEALMR
jgi:hypothetical protein